jgi:type VI secretion system protein ImpK
LGATLYGASSTMPSAPGGQRRTETLAIVYQQILTATVRIRANRQTVADAQSFRTNIHSALRSAEKDALGKGYSAEDARSATTAVVALLDESILNSANSAFADWSRMPLQQELFGHNVAGEVFFENLEKLNNRSDSPDVADLLEIYGLCLLLGFKGRYSLSGPEAVRPLVESIMARIRRIRGPLTGLSSNWRIPDGAGAHPQRDPWVRRLFVGVGVCLLVGVLLWIGFKVLLNSGATDLRTISVVVLGL